MSRISIWMLLGGLVGPLPAASVPLEVHGGAGPDGIWVHLPSPLPTPDQRAARLFADGDRQRLLLFQSSQRGMEVWVAELVGTPAWTRLYRHSLSPPGGEASMIFDPRDNRLLVFEGVDAWQLSLENPTGWEVVGVSGDKPPTRRLPRAIYDSREHRMIVYGGTDSNGSRVDTWALSLEGTQWTEIVATGEAPPRPFFHLYDPIRHRLLVFDRITSTLHLWALSLAGQPTWTHHEYPGHLPSIVLGTTFDTVADRVLVAQPGHLVEIKVGEDLNWREIAGIGAPFEFVRDIAFDAAQNRLILHQALSGETYEASFVGSIRWTPWFQLPAGRGGHATVYDSRRQRMLVLSGVHGFSCCSFPYPIYDGVLWSLPFEGPLRWQRTEHLVPARERHSAVYDERHDRVIGFAGATVGGPAGSCHPNPGFLVSYYHQSWTTDFSDPGPAFPKTTLPYTGQAGVLDTKRRQIVTFGGSTQWYACEDDRWVSRRTPNEKLRVISLDSPVAWSEVEIPDSVPIASMAPAAVYDVDRDRIWVLEGGGERGIWSVSPGDGFRWQRSYGAAGLPAQLGSPTLIYDPVRERLVLLASRPQDPQAYALPLTGGTEWVPLAPTGISPPLLQEHSALYDPDRDQMVVLGWFAHGEAWFLRWGDPLRRVGLWIRGSLGNGRGAPGSNRLFALGVLSEPDFDARHLDPATLKINGAPVATAGNGEFLVSETDVNGDGLVDVLIRVRLRDLDLAGGDGGIRVDGRTFDGQPVRGLGEVLPASDRARVVPDAAPEAPRALALYAASPVTSGRLGSVGLTIPVKADATLEILTVAGRRLHVERLGTLSAGEHRVVTSASALAPGVYFLRLSQTGTAVVRKFVVLR